MFVFNYFSQPAIALPIFTFLFLLCGYLGVSLWVWSLYIAAILWTTSIPLWGWGIFAVLALSFNLPFIRRVLFTAPIMRAISKLKLLPKISETERAAIDAGTVWIDGEFFSGQPNFQRIYAEPYVKNAPEIQLFLDNQVEKVCQMATDWEIYRRHDLPPEVWDYLKQERFFGMMIPREYGGLGFSHLAYSNVMAKLSSRSFIYTATVGVTNSLGPAKLLLSYGTVAQKDYYLPRLARGEEIPCFALTEPNAGSDAGSIASTGTVFQGEGGKLYLRLNWQKRYITLGAIATLLGLAFQLKDPDRLLGKGVDVGITCALIPTNTTGVAIDRRHDPMGVPFYNSPTEGHDVIVSIDQIIGGVEQAGQGWKMLMQSLAAGRGISFPATCAGVSKLVSRVTGDYARVRQQFGLAIGRFEGIEEPLTRIGGLTYPIDATRIYTCSAVDKGEQPAVISAIAKYNLTELARKVANDGMDILGGAGICRGPRNLLANIYTAMPIPITVEGANILTRTMMIFGQGIVRSHPYLYQEITALERSDEIAFDRALWSHLGWTIHNGFRAMLLDLTRGHLAASYSDIKPISHYERKLTWAAATFALLSDLALIGFGSTLKRREKITGRFADLLSWMYLSTATLRRFAAEGHQPEDLPLVDWSMQYAFFQMQQAFEGILANLSLSGLGGLLSGAIAWWWRVNPIGTMPSDRLGSEIARSMQTPGSQRDRLTEGIYIPAFSPINTESLARLERAFHLSYQSELVLQKIKAAIASGKLPNARPETLIDLALTNGAIAPEEAAIVREAELARQDAIQVDAFSAIEYQQIEQPSRGEVLAWQP
ncbi:acyl-CoA dehydrogenase [Pseudanabaena sp. PCC 6802]|uniref:acyl-CoA dehydrogenase n=1 Tax=Pseudanabaena sp. PCC 6802 TaxID=118173 RepID=UPI0003496331|nr:acyl-CoA dehydrogenase [Pseudanabaena sp. PCC 6802]